MNACTANLTIYAIAFHYTISNTHFTWQCQVMHCFKTNDLLEGKSLGLQLHRQGIFSNPSTREQQRVVWRGGGLFGVEGSLTFTPSDANSTQAIKEGASAHVKFVHVLCTMCITCTVYNAYEHVFPWYTYLIGWWGTFPVSSPWGANPNDRNAFVVAPPTE